MTIELILCALLMLATSRVSNAVALHYGMFFGANLFFLGYEFADSSLLAIFFAVLAIGDILLAVYGRRNVLFISAIASIALSFESIGNGDWLLSHTTQISIAVNALIMVSLIKEFRAWMSGRLAH